MQILYAVVALATMACAFFAIRAQRLLVAALGLAGASALVSIIFYLLGAHEVAVIELSVGAGLVTILFVFAISIAGEDILQGRRLIPKPLAWALVLISIGLLGWMTIPTIASAPALDEPSFSVMLWQQRGLDVLVQIALIFAGVLGLLGLLAEAKVPVKTRVPEKRAAASAVTQPGGSPTKPQPVSASQEVRA